MLMPWVRLDEQFARHPKVATAGPLGMALQVAGLCYCNEYLTDGFVPRHVVPGLLNLEGLSMRVWSNGIFGGGEDAAWELVLEDVVVAGLWHPVDGGYRIHDYHKYQPSKADVLAERKQKSEAGRLGGQKSAEARRAKASQKEAGASAGAIAGAEAVAQAKSKPVPVSVKDLSSTSTVDVSAELLVARILQVTGEVDEDALKKIRGFVRRLPESSIAKVLESVEVQRPRNTVGYVLAALASEYREKALA